MLVGHPNDNLDEELGCNRCPVRGGFPMKIRNLMLAIVALAVFAGAVTSAEARHHHRHHHHHHG